MKKVLLFKTASNSTVAFPADRFVGAFRNADEDIKFFFDDMQNTTAKAGMAHLQMAADVTDTEMKDYMKALVAEINEGKSPVILIYDSVNDTGFGDSGTSGHPIFSGFDDLVTHGA